LFLSLALNEEFGELHQVVGEDGDADKNAESFFALSKTPLHSATTEEYGNAAFDAGAESLRLFEIRTFFKGLTLRRFLSALPRN